MIYGWKNYRELQRPPQPSPSLKVTIVITQDPISLSWPGISTSIRSRASLSAADVLSGRSETIRGAGEIQMSTFRVCCCIGTHRGAIFLPEWMTCCTQVWQPLGKHTHAHTHTHTHTHKHTHTHTHTHTRSERERKHTHTHTHTHTHWEQQGCHAAFSLLPLTV